MSTSAPYFFMSYSREDASLQKRVITELRERGLNVWVDVENLIPGSPAWEREIERSIRGAAGMIVLLSPDSNESEWVRREISFAEQNEKRIFPVLIEGDEDDSIPLRLSNHQRVDLRRNIEEGLDELANALRDHIGATAIRRRIRQQGQNPFLPLSGKLKKYALPGLLAILGLGCMGMLALGIPAVYQYVNDLSTPVAVTPTDADPVATDTAIVIDTGLREPTGRIVYTCQIQGDEVCMINADGSDWHQLTNSSTAKSDASLTPGGQSILFIAGTTDQKEIYELDLNSGIIRQLTHFERNLGFPEISPDNKLITFHYLANNNIKQLWIMNRDGSNAREFFSSPNQEAHDATWSPDGTQILFAMGRGENNKLYILDLNGRDPQVVNDSIDTRGRSDWSSGGLIAFDMGGRFQHDVYLMNFDGSHLAKFTNGNNSQGASFSPNGQWIAFTAYTDVANQDQGSCEIYIMRVDGTDLRQLTDNDYCDYQPRWGN